jgi:hypothetical protein
LWCGPELGAEHSIELGKQTYSGTRRWLPDNHKYRSARMKAHFNGAVENRQKPRAVSIDEQLQYVAEYEAWKAARNKEGASGDPSKAHGVKRRSILYRLPYWKVRTLKHPKSIFLSIFHEPLL